MTPEQLFNWASKYWDKHFEWPTVAQAAKRFHVQVADIQQAVDDYGGNGYMKLAVGFRTWEGHYDEKHPGNYRIEAYEYGD